MHTVKLNNKWLPYLMIGPMVILICIFKIYPIISSVLTSFLSTEDVPTIENYKFLFADKAFWNSVKVTLKFNLYIIPIQIVIAFIMALMVNMKLRGIEKIRTILFLPFCVSLTISTIIWRMLLNINGGVVNSFLSVFGVKPIGFLIDKKWSLWSIILISSWRGCAYWMMFILAGLKGIDKEIYESAKIDGAGFFSTLFRITIPLLKNTMLFVFVANTTANFLLFAPVQIATEGGPQGSTDLLMYLAYKAGFKYSNLQRQACIVTILLIIIIGICLIQNSLIKDKDA